MGERPGSARSAGRARTVSDEWEVGEVGEEIQPEEKKPGKPYSVRKTGKRVDSPDIESGGSFGG